MNNELLPPNASLAEIALAGAAADTIRAIAVPNKGLYSPADCPSPLLPWLAWAFSVDEWNDNWSDSQKRQAIDDSIYVHRHKGTIGAVKRALAAIGIKAEVQEWFNQSPMGAPFTFRLVLTVEQVGFGTADFTRLLDLVNATKNLRSHISEISLGVVTNAGPVIGAVVLIGNEITVDGFQYSLVADGSRNADGLNTSNGFRLK